MNRRLPSNEELVRHPRFGTAFSPGVAIPADVSRQNFSVVPLASYADKLSMCRNCRRPFVFHALEQKHWYEDLGIPVSAASLVVPKPWGSRRRPAAMAFVMVPVAALLALNLWHPFHPIGKGMEVAIAAVVAGAFGVGSYRYPLAFAALACLIWLSGPVVHDGYNAVGLSVTGCEVAWLIAAPIGGLPRFLRELDNPSPEPDPSPLPA